MLFCVWVFFTFVLIGSCVGQSKAQDFGREHDFGPCSADQVKYEWERLNHYELLGFSGDQLEASSHLDSKEIRKGYRQQAQQWHPDKLKANETLTIEEINARFSTIGQAYEILNDPDTRQAYNRFLKNCKYMRGRSSSFSRDYYDYNDAYNNKYYSAQQQQEHHNQYNDSPTPTHVQKEREMRIDPMTGIPILRETTYEEFYEDQFYRISVQDYDPYHQPLYPFPQVVEEGPIHPPDYQYQYQQQQQQQQGPSTTDTLLEGAVLSSEQVLFSSNQQYRARVENCQLIVETKQKDSEIGHTGIKVVWRSPNDAPRMGPWMMEAECFLALEGGQLVIAGGSPEAHNRQILWYSIAPSDVDDDITYYDGGTYMARLENDGQVVVYRIDGVSGETCIYATGLFGCFRLASKFHSATRSVKESLTSLWDSFGHQQRNYSGFDHDDNEEKVARLLLRTALRSLAKVNGTRRRMEFYMEERTLRLVYDMESWLQERFA